MARHGFHPRSTLGALSSQREAADRLRDGGGLPGLIEDLALPSVLPPAGSSKTIRASVPLRLVGTPVERRGSWARRFLGSLSLRRGETSAALALLDESLVSSLAEGAYALARWSDFWGVSRASSGLLLPRSAPLSIGRAPRASLCVSMVVYPFRERAPEEWFIAKDASIRVAVLPREPEASVAVLVIEAGSTGGGAPLLASGLDALLAPGSSLEWRSERLAFDDGAGGGGAGDDGGGGAGDDGGGGAGDDDGAASEGEGLDGGGPSSLSERAMGG